MAAPPPRMSYLFDWDRVPVSAIDVFRSPSADTTAPVPYYPPGAAPRSSIRALDVSAPQDLARALWVDRSDPISTRTTQSIVDRSLRALQPVSPRRQPQLESSLPTRHYDRRGHDVSPPSAARRRVHHQESNLHSTFTLETDISAIASLPHRGSPVRSSREASPPRPSLVATDDPLAEQLAEERRRRFAAEVQLMRMQTRHTEFRPAPEWVPRRSVFASRQELAEVEAADRAMIAAREELTLDSLVLSFIRQC
jgi:hypothetical protein